MIGSKNNVLVTGANGQLAKSIRKICHEFDIYNFIFCDKSELDITDYDYVNKFVLKNKIYAIINCAAYTNVDLAEKNKEITNNTNNIAVGYIAKICFENNIKLIHISTDYIFDGLKKEPYDETDNTNPINYYGKTKLLGEQQILSYDIKNCIILRSSWIYSEFNDNFITKIIHKIKKNESVELVNEMGTLTNANDLAYCILKILRILKNNETQIFHFANQNEASRIEIVNEVFKFFKWDKNLISENVYKSDVKRPKYSALSTKKIVNYFDVEIKSWKNSLISFLSKSYKSNFDSK